MEVPTAETDGYVTGLEPGTNYPNARPFEERHNRVSRIDAGAVQKFDLSIEVLTNPERVSMAENEIQSITQTLSQKSSTNRNRNGQPSDKQRKCYSAINLHKAIHKVKH